MKKDITSRIKVKPKADVDEFCAMYAKLAHREIPQPPPKSIEQAQDLARNEGFPIKQGATLRDKLRYHSIDVEEAIRHALSLCFLFSLARKYPHNEALRKAAATKRSDPFEPNVYAETVMATEWEKHLRDHEGYLVLLDTYPFFSQQALENIYRRECATFSEAVIDGGQPRKFDMMDYAPQ